MTVTTAPAATTIARRVTPAEFAATAAKVEALNARAAKKGLSGSLSLTGVTTHAKVVIGEIRVNTVVVDAVLTGTAPVYNGWTFAARIDAMGAAFVVSAAPGAPAIDRDALAFGVCDHCHTTRPRTVTYVVLGADGTQMQVGSSCVADFTGHDGSFSMITAADIEGEDDIFSFGSGERTFTPAAVIAVADAAVRAFGFVRTTDLGTPTADVVRGYLYRGSDARDLAPYAADAVARAEAIMAYIASEDFAGEGDYVANMKALVAAESVTDRFIGYLASAPAAYARGVERVAQRAAKAAAAPSVHIGTVGDKIEVAVVVESIRYLENRYGTTVLYAMRTPTGSVVKWFASKEALGTEIGAAFTLRATVKDHDTYQGVAQTVITRAKAL